MDSPQVITTSEIPLDVASFIDVFASQDLPQPIWISNLCSAAIFIIFYEIHGPIFIFNFFNFLTVSMVLVVGE